MAIRILDDIDKQGLEKLMRQIRVDGYGIKIMAPKAINLLVNLQALSNIAANILKQEMLSLGGDAAIAKDALTGRTKSTDCLLMGNLSQFQELIKKLKIQPFGLNQFSKALSLALGNYQKNNYSLRFRKNRLSLGRSTRIMGILNATDDSFSGDGIYKNSGIDKSDLDAVVCRAEKIKQDGASILDIGGESSRPQAKPIPQKEEIKRVIPLVKAIAKNVKLLLSIDTYKPEVARIALDNGVSIVNDISGLRDQRMAKVIASYKAAVVIMHMKGKPSTMQKNPVYISVIDEIIEFLDAAIKRAVDSGIEKDKIIIDPGIGFGKGLEDNLEILKCLKEFKVLGAPIMVGVSRKSFIGKILNIASPQERLFGSLAATVYAAQQGASIIRAHDVKQTSEALRISDGISYH